MLNKCKIDENEVLFFGTEEDLKFPEYLKIEVLEENINITKDNEHLTILSAEELRRRLFSHKRTRDIILSENGVNSPADLKAAYFLIKYKKFNSSKSVRDFVEEKYADISGYFEKEVFNEVHD